MPNAVDLKGKIFGNLLAIEDVGVDKFGRRLWRCECSCGKETVVGASALSSENTASCGCLQYKSRKKREPKTHCKQGHPLSGENLYTYPKSGRKACLTCGNGKDVRK